VIVHISEVHEQKTQHCNLINLTIFFDVCPRLIAVVLL
jgi:hypothetical protein